MDKDFIINEQVKLFSRNIRGYYPLPHGHEDFKQDLEYELLNFYDPYDKLAFLYGVHKSLRKGLEEHEPSCTVKGDPEKCAVHSFGLKALFFTEQEIGALNPSFDYTFLRPNINSNLLKDNLILLNDFPDAAKPYLSALNKLNEDTNQRNLLDDLRLALEILLKIFLNNNKSLENQLNEIGKYLEDKNVSVEVRNMFRTLLDYFSKYHNSYIKHNDLVKIDEIDLIVNLTGAFISFLINKK
jgi:hypothetical protein